ncbi:hypothetical protein [Streptomyces sp. NPDC001985]|uniref:hypothetical protein n=1 Tax=Streptomyces sp. NPDC001985 TaxID=3154406 RepID=UPI00331F6589
MANEPDNAPIQSRYAQRFAADLEANRTEQESVSAQITELQERLTRLRADESWLSGIQGTLPSEEERSTPAGKEAAPAAGGESPAPEAPAENPAEATASRPVPKPRQGKPGAKDTAAPAARARKAPRAKAGGKAAPAVKKAAARKTAAEEKPAATEKPAEKPAAEPPLHEVVLGLLLAHAGEPRMAREVHTDLLARHPRRKTSIQVVRNNLETLVKKGVIDKEHKQGSAMYTAQKPSGDTPAAGTAADDGGAKAPAQV